MQGSILSFITQNHWLMALVVSPIAGVIWAKLLSNYHQSQANAQRLAAEQAIKQQQIVTVSGHHNQLDQSQRVINNNNTKSIYYGNKQQENDDAFLSVIAFVAISFAVLCVAAFFFAKYEIYMLLLKTIFSFSAVSLISYWWMNKNITAIQLGQKQIAVAFFTDLVVNLFNTPAMPIFFGIRTNRRVFLCPKFVPITH